MSNNKIALVTGGSRGLGRDMALNLAKKNINVVLTYHSNQLAANEVVSEIEKLGQKALALQLDVSKLLDFKEFFDTKLTIGLQEKFNTSTFDFLINNAGTGVQQSFLETTEVQFDEMLNIHFKGVYFFTQKALAYLNDKGRIINISSGLTRFSFPGASAYACMKGAVEVLTRYLAKELASRKIAANIVAPGAIATDFGGGSNRDSQEKRQIISSITALGRVGESEDIGGVVAFLCSKEAGWINGQRIEVSGGMLL